jgi:hypothetical protein
MILSFLFHIILNYIGGGGKRHKAIWANAATQPLAA